MIATYVREHITLEIGIDIKFNNLLIIIKMSRFACMTFEVFYTGRKAVEVLLTSLQYYLHLNHFLNLKFHVSSSKDKSKWPYLQN